MKNVLIKCEEDAQRMCGKPRRKTNTAENKQSDTKYMKQINNEPKRSEALREREKTSKAKTETKWHKTTRNKNTMNNKRNGNKTTQRKQEHVGIQTSKTQTNASAEK